MDQIVLVLYLDFSLLLEKKYELELPNLASFQENKRAQMWFSILQAVYVLQIPSTEGRHGSFQVLKAHSDRSPLWLRHFSSTNDIQSHKTLAVVYNQDCLPVV